MIESEKHLLWQSVLTELQLSLSGANFQTWFKGKTAILSSDKDVVEIGCSSEYNRIWIEERYFSKIKEVLDRITNRTNTIIFSVNSQVIAPKQAKKASKENPTVPLFDSDYSPSIKDAIEAANLNQKYTFSNFIVGQTNQLAYAVAKSIVDEPFDRYNPLLIYGGVGVGKTHLLQAVAHAFLLRRANAKVLYCSSEAFTNDMISAIQKKQMFDFKEKYRSLDLLLVDDIQFIAGRESTQEEFFHTFNYLYGRGKQLVFSCDRNPDELNGLQERLKNRFLGGMLAKIDSPDLELREAVLLANARAFGLKLDFSIIRALAQKLGPSIRELEGGLLRLTAVSNLTSRKIDLSLVETVIGAYKNRRDDARTLLEVVSSYFSLPLSDLLSKKRARPFVLPRQIIMYLLRNQLNHSYNDIAKFLGGRDHTTVIYSVNKVEKLVENDGEIGRIVEEIKTKVFSC